MGKMINRLNSIFYNIYARDDELEDFAAHNDNTTWRFIVNEEAHTVVALSPDNKRYVKRATKGDTFDPYTGVALAIFENYTGVSYRSLVSLMELFTTVTEENDPAITFIRRYVTEMTTIDSEDIKDVLDGAAVDKGNKTFLVNLPYPTTELSDKDTPQEKHNTDGSMTLDPLKDILLTLLGVATI